MDRQSNDRVLDERLTRRPHRIRVSFDPAAFGGRNLAHEHPDLQPRRVGGQNGDGKGSSATSGRILGLGRVLRNSGKRWSTQPTLTRTETLMTFHYEQPGEPESVNGASPAQLSSISDNVAVSHDEPLVTSTENESVPPGSSNEGVEVDLKIVNGTAGTSSSDTVTSLEVPPTSDRKTAV